MKLLNLTSAFVFLNLRGKTTQKIKIMQRRVANFWLTAHLKRQFSLQERSPGDVTEAKQAFARWHIQDFTPRKKTTTDEWNLFQIRWPASLYCMFVRNPLAGPVTAGQQLCGGLGKYRPRQRCRALRLGRGLRLAVCEKRLSAEEQRRKVKRQPCRRRIVASAASRKLSAASRADWWQVGRKRERGRIPDQIDTSEKYLCCEQKVRAPYRCPKEKKSWLHAEASGDDGFSATFCFSPSLTRWEPSLWLHHCWEPVMCVQFFSLQPIHNHVGVTIRQDYSKTASVRCRHAVSASRQNTTKGSHFISWHRNVAVNTRWRDKLSARRRRRSQFSL